MRMFFLMMVCAAWLPSAGAETLALAGDSTMASRSGWGDSFSKMLREEVRFANVARGGRSSKSFRDEGWWDKVLAEKPTWLFIQFGHNDQPGKGPKRETDPQGSYRENLSRYVREAREAGAKPVIFTPLARRFFDGQGRVIAGPGMTGGYTLADYAVAAREVAEEMGVPLVDLHRLSVADLERMGPEAAAKLNPKGRDGPDVTHLNGYGAEHTAALVAAELRKNLPEVSKLLKEAE